MGAWVELLFSHFIAHSSPAMCSTAYVHLQTLRADDPRIQRARQQLRPHTEPTPAPVSASFGASTPVAVAVPASVYARSVPVAVISTAAMPPPPLPRQPPATFLSQQAHLAQTHLPHPPQYASAYPPFAHAPHAVNSHVPYLAPTAAHPPAMAPYGVPPLQATSRRSERASMRSSWTSHSSVADIEKLREMQAAVRQCMNVHSQLMMVVRSSC